MGKKKEYTCEVRFYYTGGYIYNEAIAGTKKELANQYYELLQKKGQVLMITGKKQDTVVQLDNVVNISVENEVEDKENA